MDKDAPASADLEMTASDITLALKQESGSVCLAGRETTVLNVSICLKHFIQYSWKIMLKRLLLNT